ncbi:glyoxylase I 4 [Ricinus communis]|uniref:Lactoylglutathione lyase, putative n=1 Tax=Ricinus communis TaxID=3988 RepID=B9SPN5_RICCO|nr:glyoxylase I 4 [Ricinus communis]EEF34443.1 lactoylglutathione lyase, putative [Ricinus communis]|eukprot:XP_002527954.1 lactoylglutathione lyase [Ricinus communis]
MEMKEERKDSNNEQVKMIKESNDEKKEEKKDEQPPLMALNHVSRLCRDVQKSIDFYTKVLGMVLTERPQAFDFEGAWLFNYGVGIHLVQAKDEDRLPDPHQSLDPMDNHISFQCEDIEAMEKRLKEHKVEYIKRTVDENGTKIDQLFFDDPDGFMIEICNCENLKLAPAGSIGKIKLPKDRHIPPVDVENGRNDSKTESSA